MSGYVHFNEDIACILAALALANRIPTAAPDTREVRLYRAGFQAGLQMVAEALGITTINSRVGFQEPDRKVAWRST